MAIEDVDVVGSPGWWMQRLSRQLVVNKPRLERLETYWAGNPKLPGQSNVSGTPFAEYMRTCVTNFASLIASAPVDQIELRSVMTAAQNDPEGDARAWQYVTGANFDLALLDAALLAKKFGWSYLATSPALNAGEPPVITAEDPRLMAHETHPTDKTRIRAAFKVYYDSEAELDVAMLWLPGETWVATRARAGSLLKPRSSALTGAPEPSPSFFDASAFSMCPLRTENDGDGFFSERYEDDGIPIELILNPGGAGEYELHLPLLDRINNGIMNRLVIASLQAFKQKALVTSGTDAPDIEAEDDDGNPINLDDMFSADPGSLWILPPGRTLWESGQVDLTGILSSVKDDVLHLAAVSGTPMSMFTPDAVTTSAEGVQLTREVLTNKVRRFQTILGRAGGRALARAFQYMGDEQRGDATQMQLVFFPPQRYSLAEQGQAASQAGDSLTWEQKQDVIWQRTPSEIAQARTQRMQDLMFQQVAANASAAPAPPTAQTSAPVSPVLVSGRVDDNADATV